MSTKIYVWDKFVRIFHWSLVALFITSYLTGEDESDFHIYSGYAILALVLARIIWGLIGTRYARFTDFIKGPKTVITYAKSMVSGHPKHYLGHNPLGGLMVIALLLTLLVTTISGLKLLAIEEGEGPFASSFQVSLVNQAYGKDDSKYRDKKHREDDDDEDLWEDIHETAVNLMLFLIALHITGVVISSWVHKESLIKSMVTGSKERQSDQ